MANDTQDDLKPGMQEALTGYHIRRASSVFTADFAAAMATTNMRQGLFSILAVVASNPGVSQSQVGNALGIQRANMVSLVNELVERNLIRRDVAADDRRAFALELTPAGEAMVVDCLATLGRHEDALMSCLSSAERMLLIGLLRRIHEQAVATEG